MHSFGLRSNRGVRGNLPPPYAPAGSPPCRLAIFHELSSVFAKLACHCCSIVVKCSLLFAIDDAAAVRSTSTAIDFCRTTFRTYAPAKITSLIVRRTDTGHCCECKLRKVLFSRRIVLRSVFADYICLNKATRYNYPVEFPDIFKKLSSLETFLA